MIQLLLKLVISKLKLGQMATVQSNTILGQYEFKTEDGEPGAEPTLSGCCHQKECGHLLAACLQGQASVVSTCFRCVLQLLRGSVTQSLSVLFHMLVTF